MLFRTCRFGSCYHVSFLRFSFEFVKHVELGLVSTSASCACPIRRVLCPRGGFLIHW
jgi:hypothetical protein